MTRDMGLVREILLAMERSPSGYARDVEVAGHDAKTIGYHVYLMAQAGLVTADDMTTFGDDGPYWSPRALTWAGYEFIEASRDPAVWERAYTLAKKAGNAAFPIVVQALTNIALERLKAASHDRRHLRPQEHTDQTGVADEQKSIARQIEHARLYAVRKGWQVDDTSIFVDDGIRSAEFDNRPDFMRLMAPLKPRPSFQVLIMSEESRLGRE